jgi:two-component system, sensor histidine kinase and response regulator
MSIRNNPDRLDINFNMKEQPDMSKTDKKKKPLILLAEDSETNTKLMLNIFEAIGLECDTVENGKEAVEACTNKDYNLVFMDCQMPFMNGYEAASKIRSIMDIYFNIVIIAITANSEEGEKEKCLSAGMDDYICKPVSMKRIKDIINKYDYILSENVKSTERESGSFTTIVNNLMNEAEISSEQAKEIIAEYIDDLPLQINMLYKNIEISDFAAASRIFHKMKGTASTLCVNHLLELLIGLEKELPDIKKETLDSNINKMKEYIKLLKSEIDKK